MRLFREVKESDDPKYTVISEGEHYDKQWVCDVEPAEITEEYIVQLMDLHLYAEQYYMNIGVNEESMEDAAKAILSKLRGE